MNISISSCSRLPSLMNLANISSIVNLLVGKLNCRYVVFSKLDMPYLVRYGISKGLDTAYWVFLGVGTTLDIFQNIHILYLQYDARIRRIFLDGYGVLVVRIVIFKISSFKLQNARLLLIFTKYS
ncbi:hypothetical protein Tco_1178773, partial [Tanacetum coccineum]